MSSSLSVGLKIIITSGGCGLIVAICFEPHPSLYSSKYDHSTAASMEEQYHDVKALPPVGTAVWHLMLAMLAKAVLTIFTFGMKVCTIYSRNSMSVTFAVMVFVLISYLCVFVCACVCAWVCVCMGVCVHGCVCAWVCVYVNRLSSVCVSVCL